MKQIYKYIIILLLFSFTAKSNNVQVSSVEFADQNVGTGEVSIQLNISWDNSWRVSTAAPNNWDAVWLFAKYKKTDGTWHHCTLCRSNYSSGQGTPATLSVRGDSLGAYLYRSGDGTGTFSSNDVKLRWDYEANGIGCNLGKFITEIKVFAIEMVYIPQGAFYVGSGGSENNHFYTYGSNAPYQINSEGVITVGTSNGNLYYLPRINWAGDATGSIPSSFPKGFNAFYCMKYEITQEQYCDFLNMLTSTQQVARFPNQFNNHRHFIKLLNGVYGCDANNNGVLNESSDGQNIACNYLCWSDGAAYSDWSGLRPMTELEYEKACRGPLAANTNEYAWGNIIILPAINLSNSGESYENITEGNCHNSSSIVGPLRAGIFATNNSTRQSSGSSFYGVMEMSGNLWEYCVTVGNSEGRAYTGLHGNGTLNILGSSDVENWILGNANGEGARGGSWDFYGYDCGVSDRICAAYFASRNKKSGFRCVGGI